MSRIDKFKALAEQFPTSEVPLFSLGQAYYEDERFEEAADAFGRVIELKPDYMMAYILLGQSAMRLSQYERAREAIVQARDLAISQDHEEPLEDCNELLEEIDEELGLD